MRRYTIWDRENGGPASRKIYETHRGALKACERMNAKKTVATGRYYVKEL